MPEVHFIGAIEAVSGAAPEEELSVTWAFVPGNEEWFIQKGSFFGETQICQVAVDGRAVMNHPLDVQFNTESSEGWPRLVCELWQRENSLPLLDSGGAHGGGNGDLTRGFIGCGCVWLPPPSCSGQHTLDIPLWKPVPPLGSSLSSTRSLTECLLPSIPDMERLRDIAINPNTRATTQTQPAGEIRVSLHSLVTKDFNSFGVHM